LLAHAQALFEPHLKRFYVNSSDPGYIRNLKLEIMTSLATEANVNIILRELQSYMRHPDKAFVTAAIHALGRCAINVPDVAEKCLAGLMRLINDQNGGWAQRGGGRRQQRGGSPHCCGLAKGGVPAETIVAESVVVIKRLLQLKHDEHPEMIAKLGRALKHISVPEARAAIIWCVAAYARRTRQGVAMLTVGRVDELGAPTHGRAG